MAAAQLLCNLTPVLPGEDDIGHEQLESGHVVCPKVSNLSSVGSDEDLMPGGSQRPSSEFPNGRIVLNDKDGLPPRQRGLPRRRGLHRLGEIGPAREADLERGALTWRTHCVDVSTALTHDAMDGRKA